MPVFTLNSATGIDTTYSSPSGTYNVGDNIILEALTLRGYVFRGWQITGNGSTRIEVDSHYEFYMPNYDVTVTPISALIEYKILYNNLEGATVNPPNPDRFTIESPTFTLTNQTKPGYYFLGWAGSNGSTPERDVTIPHGSAGDKVYYAAWQATSSGGIIINGQPLVKRIIDGHEVQKVIYNGNQIRPTS